MDSHAAQGSLLIIGGLGDEVDDRDVLQHFIALSAGAGISMVVLTAASDTPCDIWRQYRAAFAAAVAFNVMHVPTADRSAAALESMARLGADLSPNAYRCCRDHARRNTGDARDNAASAAFWTSIFAPGPPFCRGFIRVFKP